KRSHLPQFQNGGAVRMTTGNVSAADTTDAILGPLRDELPGGLDSRKCRYEHVRMATKLVTHLLQEATSVYELIVVVNDAVKAVGALHDIGILHRDVSVNNIMFARGQDDEPCGVLIDLDSALLTDDASLGSNRICTGTAPFMSVNNLERLPKQKSPAGKEGSEKAVPALVDELESFLYVLIWHGVWGATPEHREQTLGQRPKVVAWLNPLSAENKRDKMSSKVNLGTLTEEFYNASNYETVASNADPTKNTKWVQDSYVFLEELEGVHRVLFDTFADVIDKRAHEAKGILRKLKADPDDLGMATQKPGSNAQSMLEAFMFGIFTDESQAKQQYLSIVGLLYQAGINIALCAGAFLLFVFLRPNNARVYARRYKALVNDERRPPKMSRGLFAWVPILWRADEKHLLDTVGIDSVFFLRFMRLGIWLMGIFGAVGMCLIVPMNFTNGNNDNVTSNIKLFQLQWITLYHITKLKVFWLHAACVYVFTGVFLFFAWREYKRYIQVRQQNFQSPEYLRKLQSRTIMLTRVPRVLQNDHKLRVFITKRGSSIPPLQVSVARKIGQLQELINDHERAVRKLERLLHKYLAGGIDNKPRPQIKVKGHMVDGIDHYAADIESLEFVIGQTRREIETFKPASVGFVSYASPPHAHSALRALRKL
ncbi:hypothetical protein H4R21_004197, partial [Coemansia helicoidea]